MTLNFLNSKETCSKGIIYFVIITFCITYLMDAFIFLNGGLKYNNIFVFLITMMFVPLIVSTLLTKFYLKRPLTSFGIKIGTSLKYYLVAYFYPFLALGLGFLLFALMGFGKLSPNLDLIFPSQYGIPIYIYLTTYILAPVFPNSIFAFGEEYGWRGYLQDLLLEKFSISKTLIIVGIIWGLWHAPLIAMGYNYNQYPLPGVFLFVLWTTFVGIFFGWLKIRSKSVMTAALGHGAVNAYIGFGIIFAQTNNQLLGVPFGLPGLIAFLILAIIFFLDLKRNYPKNF
ncbi:MAG: CAAX amino terminal protease self- immunity [Candidatus Methanofastidiosum methylothiophilum]|uniref:CAAX amino terminal protease self-immunity n=1 Tax=Candidatus Methanofastidiosum methylothiophilum TaxID=1705564 RepID=A0A150J5F8_9EURY|nr:MAG: CAAX amino terminal protease self- immunity [Candidatus Methanofastidiosum methylthiophilus]